MILDYTSDSVRENNFTQWGVVNKFPWLFGIFSGYEPNSEIRGFYELTNERLRIAKADPMCKGMIFWPELSHGDPLAIDYFAKNAWEAETPEVAARVAQYCADRYPQEIVQQMQAVWQRFMPIVELTAWSVDQSYQHHGSDYFPRILDKAKFEMESAGDYGRRRDICGALKEEAVEVLNRLAALPVTDELTRRDFYDIARTVIGRFVNAGILWAEHLFTTGAAAEELYRATELTEALMQTLTELLGTHDDYSLLASLRHLQSVTETNPNFEGVLKNNASCNYNRSYIYENARYLYLPEMQHLFAQVKLSAQTGAPIDRRALDASVQESRKRYFEISLSEMERVDDTFAAIVSRAAVIIKQMGI